MENPSSEGLGAGGWALAGTQIARSPQIKGFLFAVLAGFAFLITTIGAQSPERARTEGLARRAAERLQALQREADRLTSEARTVIGDLRKLEIERQIRAEELKRVDADAEKVQAELDQTSARLQMLQTSASMARPELEQ